MSRRDLQETEGDPFIKARLKSLRLARARRRMMAEVPSATVVVTNPTHVAIALRYDPTMAAPRLVAKAWALWPRGSAPPPALMRCRSCATRRSRALHGGIEPGVEVPPAHYRAVAEVIGYVLRLKGRR